MTGAVLNTINTRLDPRTVAFILDHGEAKLFIVDSSLSAVAKKALTEAEVIAWCRDNLVRDKVPSLVVFGPLPKTPTGKIQKFVLRDRARDAASQRTTA